MDTDVLEYESKGLATLPRDDPNYSKATVLLMRDNKLKTFDASELPPRLTYLDLSENTELEHIIGTFPETLEGLILDGTNLATLPPIPSNLTTLAIENTPIGNQLGIRTTLSTRKNINAVVKKPNTSEKYIEWTAIDYSRNIFTEEEQYKIGFLSVKDFIQRKEEIKSEIMSNEKLCRSIIGKDYLNTILDTTTNVIVEKESGIIVAFCFFHINPSSLYIDIICSSQANKGGGSRILDILLKYMKVHEDIKTINLESVHDSIGFYEKKRFKRCNANKLCPMVLMRSDLSKSQSKTRSKNTKSKSKTARRRTV